MPTPPRFHIRGRILAWTTPIGTALAVCAALAIAASTSHAALDAVPPDTLVSNVTGRHLGRTVAAAGDVNGDGYSDVLVTGIGTVALYRGGPSGNPFDPSRLLWSKVNFPYGVQAAGIGDVDGDGYDDIAVAWGFRVRVYYGSANGVDTTRTFDFSPSVSTSDVAQYPVVVAPAGDVNGDGLPDLLVGSAESQCGPGNTGVVWVFYGAAGTGLSAGSVTEICASTVSVNAFGASVATAGDVNKDGYTDVVVGAPSAPNGHVYVYLGGPGGLSTTASRSLSGTQSGGQFGASVCTAGDVNGDGYADVLVGAPNESFSTLTGDGTAYLFLGGSGGVAATAAWLENGAAAGDHMGTSVATAGDVNGDGLADFLVGIPDRSDPELDEGQFALFMGNASAGSIVTTLFPESNAAGALFGACVAAAGDVNGDGIGDVLVAAPDAITPQVNAGAVYLYFGHQDMPDKTAPFSTWFGGSVGSLYGTSVAVGDFSGDGIPDLAVGAPGVGSGGLSLQRGGSGGIGVASGLYSNGIANAGLGTSLAMNGDLDADGFADLAVGAVSRSSVDSGAVYVFRGNSGGTLSTVYAVLRAPGAAAGDGFGTSVTWADVDGDGHSDLIVGSPDWNGPLGAKQGRVLVYLTGAAGLSTGQAPSSVLAGPRAGSLFGASVACAGDVNRDGVSDVVVGAPNDAVPNGPILTLPNGGYAALYLGGRGGLASTPVAAITGTGASGKYPGDQLGTCVSAAGDLDGDGYGDVAIGALNSNVVMVWYGGAAGVAATTTLSGPVPGSGFGMCLAPGGDLDGDGNGDLLVGAPYMTGDTADMEGRVFLYRGSASRTFGAADWYKDGGAANAALGSAIAAGDLNGDGFVDIAVGAPDYDGGTSQQGYVQTFLGDRGTRYLPIFALDPANSHTIQPRATSSTAAFNAFGGKGRSPLGRVRMRLTLTADRVAYGSEHAVASGLYSDNGSAFTFQDIGVTVAAGRPYAWRARWQSQSPLAPWTPWVPGSLLGANTYAVLTGALPLSVAPATVGHALSFAPPSPSPFTGASVSLAFALPAAGRATLRLYDVSGRARRTLADDWMAAGPHAIAWDGRDDAGHDLSPGVYFARLESGALRATRRIVRIE